MSLCLYSGGTLTNFWRSLIYIFQGVVKVGAVNVDEHKELGGKFDVRGFPTIKIFSENKFKPEDYNGARTAKDIVEAALKAARNKVKSNLDGGSSKSSGGSGGVSCLSLCCT